MGDPGGQVHEDAAANVDVAPAAAGPVRGGPALGYATSAQGPAAALLRMQASAGNRATVRWLATNRRTLARKTWHQERAEALRAAIKTDPATWDDAGGVFYLLNGLNKGDQVKVLSALNAGERKRIEDSLPNTKLDRAAMYQSLQQANAGSEWWQNKSNEVHAAIRRGDFVTYPTGAYWVINPLNDADRVKIMTFLGADHLDQLIDNDDKAVEAGVPNAVSIAEAAKKARANRKEAQRDPLQTLVPGTWVDDFTQVVYDMEYRIAEGGSPSNWMQVHYKDGTKVDLNWYDFDDVKLTGDEVKEALKNRYLGPGGRVFPKREPAHKGRLGLTRQLCPRLWAMHDEVTEIGAESTIELMTLSMTAVMFILTMPAMPVGPAPAAGASSKVTRRMATRGSGAAGRIPRSTGLKMEGDFRTEIRRVRDKLVTIPGSTKEAKGGVGPVLSGCLDKKSGEIFYAVNQGKVPQKMHPLLKARYEGYLARAGGATPETAGVAGAHSEIGALNKALWARDPAGKMTSIPADELVMHNASLYRNRPEGVPPMCTNCAGIVPPEIKFLP